MADARTTELKHRVEARRKELEARLHELAADTSASSREAADRVRESLDDLRDQAVERWEELSQAARARLDEWLRRTDKHVGAQSGSSTG